MHALPDNDPSLMRWLRETTWGNDTTCTAWRRARWGLLPILAVLLLGTQATGQATYVGSDSCLPCHEQQWNDHRVSGHPHMLKPAGVAESWPLPLPEEYAWSDIRYVIGGYRWKAQYVGANGYLITTAGGEPGNNRYNLATGEFVDDHAGQTKPFDCGGCHTTGYSAFGNQDGLPGIVGTWELDGVQCERCHGPGSDHVALPQEFNIIVNDDACDSCHTRGAESKIPAQGGFVLNYTQRNELLASPHFFLDCATCHDPHRRAEFSIRLGCTDCHTDMANEKAAFKPLGRRHLAREVGCVECHMPHAVLSAAPVNPFQGDVRSHQFRINLKKDAAMFSPDGSFANGQLTAGFVCLGCHQNVVNDFQAQGKPAKAEQWARKHAKKIHK